MNCILKGGLTLNEKKFRIDNDTYDEPFINVDFITVDDYKTIFGREEKQRIGQAVLKEIRKIVEEKCGGQAL